MTTRKKLERFIEERSAYMEACRLEYGYLAGARSRSLETSPLAGFSSALFGSALTLYVYSHYNFQPLFSFLKTLQYVEPSDAFTLLVSFIQGIL